jgi:hypothetical protein
MSARQRVVLPSSKQRSHLSNGHALPRSADMRSAWARRYKDLLQIHLADLNGADACSAAEQAILKRACTLITECERMEARFATNGGATLEELETFQRASNTMKRLLVTLGLERRMKDVSTPSLGQLLREDDLQQRQQRRDRHAEQSAAAEPGYPAKG